MDLRTKIALVAAILLAAFVLASTIGAFLFCVGNSFWPLFATLGVSCLVASWMMGND